MHKTKGTLSIIPAVKHKPFLFINRELYNTVSYLVNHKRFANKEVQWYHCVAKHEDTDGNICYELTDIVIPPQTVSATEADTTPEQQLQVWYEIKERHTIEGEFDKDAANAFVASMTCWNHSHVNMGVNPSGQDNSQFKDFIINNDKVDADQIFIMMIWNRKGELYTRIYDPSLGYSFESVPLHIENEGVDNTYIEDAIKNKIKEKAWVSKASHNSHNNHSGYRGPFNTIHRPTAGGSGNALAPKNKGAASQGYNSVRNSQSTMEDLVGGTMMTTTSSTHLPNTKPINTEIYSGTVTPQERDQIISLVDYINVNHGCAKEAEDLAYIVATILDADGAAIKAFRHLLGGTEKDKAVLKRWQKWEDREFNSDQEVALLTEDLLNGWWPSSDAVWMSISIADELGHCSKLSEVVDLVTGHFELTETLEQAAVDQIAESPGATVS